MELWASTGIRSYEVSNLGSVRGSKWILKPELTHDGYPKVYLYLSPGRKKTAEELNVSLYVVKDIARGRTWIDA